MILYAIHYNSRPRIRFACATTVETEVPKRNIIDHRKNIIELAYYTGDAFSLQVDETLYPIAQSDIFLIMPDARYEPICGAGKHTITCLAVEIDDLSYDILDSDDPQMLYDAISAADADTVFLPRITQMEDRDFQMLTALFRAAINNYAAGTTPRHLLALSGWYEILSLLDGQVRAWAATQVQTASQSEESSGHLYVRKAKNYICTNFSRRISLAEIAEDMGITE
ncbi:MAG: hypothetical protein IJ302_10205, partial [Clostridia bacterium]|nr:hypothetical protein [Clostridia bacterium]